MREARRSWVVVCVCAAVCAFMIAGGAQAQVVDQITDTDNTVSLLLSVLDDAGTTVYAPVATNQLGGNPDYKLQLFKFNAVTGAATQIVALDEGLSLQDFPESLEETLPKLVSVSDSGDWIAFMSLADPFGTNKDRSTELFVIKQDGTSLAQLTSDTGPNAGDVTALDIDGSGNKIFFFARQNPSALGTNPNRYGQLFSINRDGTGIAQLTTFTADGTCTRVSVSDDGTRIAFGYDGDPLTTNADGSEEVFKISSTGTGLTQLTSGARDSVGAFLAGNGTKIVFQSKEDHTPTGTNSNPAHYNEVFVINWDGTGLLQLIQTDTSGQSEGLTRQPVITDDATAVLFVSNHKGVGSLNIDLNAEVFRSGSDGTGLQNITDTQFSAGQYAVNVSGDGSRVSFASVHDFFGVSNNADESFELYAKSSTIAPDESDLIQLTVGVFGVNRDPDVTSDGSTVVFMSRFNHTGADPDRGGEIYTMNFDGTSMFQVTDLGFAQQIENPSISANGQDIVFTGDPDDPAIAPNNPNGSKEVFHIDSAGTTMTQLSDDIGLGQASKAVNPVISEDGSWVYWEANNDQLGTNLDISREIFRSDTSGGSLLQLTSGVSGDACRKPRTSADGTWVVFESYADLTSTNADGSWEVYRVKFDGTGTQQITNGTASVDSFEPDISDDGSIIVYASSWNPLGTNADGNQEIFSYNVGTTTHTQVTSTTSGTSSFPRISNDGRYVYFLTTSDMFETDPDRSTHQARADLQTATIVRTGGIDDGNPTPALPTSDGQKAVFSGLGNFTRENYDIVREIWVIDTTALNSIVLSGPAPTSVSWKQEPGALRYDVVRGDVANLASGGPGITNLGAVVCLEDNTIDTDTVGDEDVSDPAAGQAYFYVYRAIQGLNVGPSHYGESSNGDDRTGGAGNCSL